MQKKIDKKVYRIIDANFNRTKEGLRVCEDICRFFYNKKIATKKYKDIRHDLTKAISKFGFCEIIQARDIEGDVGKRSSCSESLRRQTNDIFYANAQRVKESLRVLEEFAKLTDSTTAERIKELRYKVYDLEKEISRQIKRVS